MKFTLSLAFIIFCNIFAPSDVLAKALAQEYSINLEEFDDPFELELSSDKLDSQRKVGNTEETWSVYQARKFKELDNYLDAQVGKPYRFVKKNPIKTVLISAVVLAAATYGYTAICQLYDSEGNLPDAKTGPQLLLQADQESVDAEQARIDELLRKNHARAGQQTETKQAARGAGYDPRATSPEDLQASEARYFRRSIEAKEKFLNSSAMEQLSQQAAELREATGRLPNFCGGLNNICYLNSVLQILAQRSDAELTELFDQNFEENLELGETLEIAEARTHFKTALRAVLAALKNPDNHEVMLTVEVPQYGVQKKFMRALGFNPEPDEFLRRELRVPSHLENQSINPALIRNMADWFNHAAHLDQSRPFMFDDLRHMPQFGIREFVLADGRQEDASEFLKGALNILNKGKRPSMEFFNELNGDRRVEGANASADTVFPLWIPIDRKEGTSMQDTIDAMAWGQEEIEYRFDGDIDSSQALRSYSLPASTTLTFAVENRIYPEPESLRLHEEAQLINSRHQLAGSSERVHVPPVIQKKNTTELILNPIINVPVFNPADRRQTGTQSFKVRAAALQAGNAHSGHYTTQVFAPDLQGIYSWREHNDDRNLMHDPSAYDRRVNSRVVEYVPFGEPVYD